MPFNSKERYYTFLFSTLEKKKCYVSKLAIIDFTLQITVNEKTCLKATIVPNVLVKIKCYDNI